MNQPLVRLSSLFWGFFTVSALTIGGGYAMIPVIEKRVQKNEWMEASHFRDIFTIAQACPGAIAMNTAFLVGKDLRGWLGGCIAWLGVLLPPYLSIIVVAGLYSVLSANTLVQGFLRGAYGACIGIVTALLFRSVKNKNWSWPHALIALLTLLALLLFKGFAIIVIPVGIVVALAVSRLPWKR
jgi:chromate transporter